MIVLEGPDGAGKTTLKQDLLMAIPSLNPIKRHCDSDGPITDLRHWIDRDNSQLFELTDLYDRHALISEPIYGPIVRGSVAEGFDDPEWYLSAWGAFLAKRPLIIFCQPPIEYVVKNVGSSYQMGGVESRIRAIYYSYHYLNLQLKAQGYRKIITWDYTKKDQRLYFNFITQVITQGVIRGGY